MNKSADAYAIRDVLKRQIEYLISCEDLFALLGHNTQ